MIYNIIEVANCHGGNFNYLMKLIDETSSFNQNFGIKFQPFFFNEIATQDFSWYEVYKEFFFELSEWNQIIKEAFKTKDIWIDVSGEYSCKVIEANINIITGIKFQSSMLFNDRLFDSLDNIGFHNKKVILNVSGLTPIQIDFFTQKIERLLRPNELILQVGFQAYPTKIEDIGFTKVNFLKENFH